MRRITYRYYIIIINYSLHPPCDCRNMWINNVAVIWGVIFFIIILFVSCVRTITNVRKKYPKINCGGENNRNDERMQAYCEPLVFQGKLLLTSCFLENSFKNTSRTHHNVRDTGYGVYTFNERRWRVSSGRTMERRGRPSSCSTLVQLQGTRLAASGYSPPNP